MKNKLITTRLFLLLLTATFLSASPVWAKGNPKGILDKDEIYFLTNTLFPILIKSKLCVSATGDCIGDNYILCLSDVALRCDVYGITDEKVIKEILLAVLNSGLKTSSFTFWRSNHQYKSLFEKPLLEFIDRTGGKSN